MNKTTDRILGFVCGMICTTCLIGTLVWAGGRRDSSEAIASMYEKDLALKVEAMKTLCIDAKVFTQKQLDDKVKELKPKK